MGKIAELKGQNGLLIVHDEYLEISRNTFGGFVSQGGSSGIRRFYYKDIAGVEYKTPTFISNGYIKVLISGTEESNSKVGIFGSSMKSMKDQNTVVLRAFTKNKSEESDKVHQIVMNLIEKNKTDRKPTSSTSKIDELTKLGELYKSGILTEEEFLQEKAKLLNR